MEIDGGAGDGRTSGQPKNRRHPGGQPTGSVGEARGATTGDAGNDERLIRTQVAIGETEIQTENPFDRTYLQLMKEVGRDGDIHHDRTGTGTVRVFGQQLRFDLREGFPLITTKKAWWKGIATELLWFLSGETSVKPLVDEGVGIWTANAYDFYCTRAKERGLEPVSKEQYVTAIREADGEPGLRGYSEKGGERHMRETVTERLADLGPIYGKQWRDFQGEEGRVDQIEQLIRRIRHRPESRRHLVVAWHPAEIDHMAVPPCHYAFQCFIEGAPGRGDLTLMFNMRSTDVFLGLVFNIASYALLAHIIAHQCDLQPKELIFQGGDCHLYRNHLDVAREQIGRTGYPPPKLTINPGRDVHSVDDYQIDDFELTSYNHEGPLMAEMAV